jgi:hypothetical protein
MKRGLLPRIPALLLFAAACAGGCSSSQMGRIDRNRAIYETWPLEVRQAVLDGRVEPGMDQDMVRVAWGEPGEVSISPAGDEIWIYAKGGDPGGAYYPGSRGGMMGGGMGGTAIGVSTGRGGTVVGTSSSVGIGIGGGSGGIAIGGGGVGIGTGGIGGPIMSRPVAPDLREVVFRNGTVIRADKP